MLLVNQYKAVSRADDDEKECGQFPSRPLKLARHSDCAVSKNRNLRNRKRA